MREAFPVGVISGFVVSAAGVWVGVSTMADDDHVPYAAWLLPATFVLGVVLIVQPRHRRFGKGLVVGSLVVALAVFGWLLALGAAIGS